MSDHQWRSHGKREDQVRAVWNGELGRPLPGDLVQEVRCSYPRDTSEVVTESCLLTPSGSPTGAVPTGPRRAIAEIPKRGEPNLPVTPTDPRPDWHNPGGWERRLADGS